MNGLTLAKDGTIYGKDLCCESKSIQKFLSEVEGIINTSGIFGDEQNLAHVSIVHELKEKVLGQLHLGTQFSYPVRAWLFLLPNW
jgi:hypothetical protein